MSDLHHKRIVKRIEALQAKLPKKDEVLQRYAKQFFLNGAERYVLEGDEAELLAIVKNHWEFVHKRKQERSVRVYNPIKSKHGWDSERSVLEFTTKDTPFILDSVTAELTRRGFQTYEVIHPVLHLKRSKAGIEALYEGGDDVAADATFESSMHFQISHIEDAAGRKELEDAIENTLHFVDLTVEDWRPMRHRTDDILLKLGSSPNVPFDQEYISEVRDFLSWVLDNNFIFLGYREYHFYNSKGSPEIAVTKGTELGIFRAEAKVEGTKPEGLSSLPENTFSTTDAGELLTITKSSRKSVVHRHALMDYIGVKIFDSAGKVIGEHRLLGLFTSSVYYQSALLIPIIRKKIQAVISRAGFPADSHNGKALVTVLESYPRDELLQIDEEELFYICMGIVELAERPSTRLFIRKDKYLRFVSCIVFLPRDRFNTRLRERIQHILEQSYAGQLMDYYTQVTESSLARMHVMIRIDPFKLKEPNLEEVEALLIEATSSWMNGLRLRLNERVGERAGERLFNSYVKAFPETYKDMYHFGGTYGDIIKLEEAIETKQISVELYQLDSDGDSDYQLKLYHPRTLVTISEVLPLIENMGFEAVDEQTFEIHPESRPFPVWLHHFRLKLKDSALLAKLKSGLPKLEDIKEQFEEALLEIHHHKVEDDLLNRLIIRARLTWREVMLLRAYVKYSIQTDLPYSDDFIAISLTTHPILTQRMVQYFDAKFNPSIKKKEREEQLKLIESQIEKSLYTVQNVSEDRVIRQIYNTMRATLRTNYYQKDAQGAFKPYLSIKLDSKAVPNLPLPRLYREIFVYSYYVEGIHLRGGSVARGGLRWSDRQEDFRTEVLGLVKAQMVKNAVIVPVGSKGGFVVKHPQAEREAYIEQGKECYKTYLSGLLDITDNIVSGKVVPPENVVRYDVDDPYLVVAADKGTATFSDIANGVAADYGFWLGDAFASGGSVGYDHKKMGITARGAWVSVQRHFQEMGHDTQSEDFTVVGIGDMAGDVFGNGMLLSRHIRLVAAFNHMHIFIDPEPDAAKSYQERQRLFKLPRSSWKDYDNSLISKGGGVYERSAKAISLTPQVQKLLGVKVSSLSPEELIKTILKAKVDLLWNGGIGTYVKATSESHDQVGDKANDNLRVNAQELGAKVVGEGGNLGLTQRARIEYAQHGGRINTDAIDNSAGVDCSDHEVNIKIGLGAAVSQKKLSLVKRNELLESMTDDVAQLVLRDNTLQTLALTMDEQRGNMILESKSRLMKHLEETGQLDRVVEFLPDEEEISRRSSDGRGLTRPELAVLLAYSKLELYSELLHTNLPDDPYFENDLIRYFPEGMQDKFKKQILDHQLKREIICTVTANSIVNRMGSTFFNRMKEDTGMKGCDIGRSYTAARETFGLRDLWQQIEDIEHKVSVETSTKLYLEARRLVERSTTWFLRTLPQPINVATTIAAYKEGVDVLKDQLDRIMSPVIREVRDERLKTYKKENVPTALATQIANMEALSSSCDIVHVAKSSVLPTIVVGEVYFALGKRLRLGWLRMNARKLISSSHWENLAIQSITDTLFDQQMRLAADVTGESCQGKVCEVALEGWLKAHKKDLERYDNFINELKKQDKITSSMLSVALQRVEAL